MSLRRNFDLARVQNMSVYSADKCRNSSAVETLQHFSIAIFGVVCLLSFTHSLCQWCSEVFVPWDMESPFWYFGSLCSSIASHQLVFVPVLFIV